MPRVRPELPALTLRRHRGVAPTDARGAFSRDAYEQIRGAILDCTLLPGTALSEQALSDGLGVSRAPVRDALRQLAAEGLVQVVPQRGTYVSLIDPQRVRDAVFVREVIECRAAELAAQALLERRLALRDLLQQQIRASDAGDYRTHLETDEALHLAILELAGHPHAWPALRLARTGMNRIRHLAIAAVGSHRIAIDHHRLIVEAIVAGDGALAAERMRVHIRSPLDFLEAIAQRHPAFVESPAAGVATAGG